MPSVSQEVNSKIRLVLTDFQEQIDNDSLAGVFSPFIETFTNPVANVIPNGETPNTAPLGNVVAYYDWAVENVRDWQSEGKVAAWVIPKAAGLAFLSALNASVTLMIAAGPPPGGNPSDLQPGVSRFVEIQSLLFASVLGAD